MPTSFSRIELTHGTSMDWETESIMQEIVDTEFKDQTVIAVMHRLRYVEQYDRVVLMKQGEVIECDSPQSLLASDSQFRGFHRAMQHS